MRDCELRRLRGGRFKLVGHLGFGTAAGLLKESSRSFADDNAVAIDLSEVTDVDSAGLALLLEWLSWAQRESRQLQFENIPDKLLAIARISEVEDILCAGGHCHDQPTKATC
jgi:phospholipid transport system transporter-binding protein